MPTFSIPLHSLCYCFILLPFSSMFHLLWKYFFFVGITIRGLVKVRRFVNSWILCLLPKQYSHISYFQHNKFHLATNLRESNCCCVCFDYDIFVLFRVIVMFPSSFFFFIEDHKYLLCKLNVRDNRHIKCSILFSLLKWYSTISSWRWN